MSAANAASVAASSLVASYIENSYAENYKRMTGTGATAVPTADLSGKFLPIVLKKSDGL